MQMKQFYNLGLNKTKSNKQLCFFVSFDENMWRLLQMKNLKKIPK